MNETEFQDALMTLLEEMHFMDEDDRENAGLPAEMAVFTEVRTFGDAGLLTNNAGLVVTMANGSEFQLTIVQSR